MLPGQSGKIVATFISTSTSAGGRQRQVEVERLRHGPDGEELHQPAEALEDDRGAERPERGAQHGEALRGPSSRADGAGRPAPSVHRDCVRRAEITSRR